MTTNQEIVATLITEQTLYYVNEQFDRRDEFVDIESFGMKFRLHNPTTRNINLELAVRLPIETGGEREVVNIPGLGEGIIQPEIEYYKPIGFYTNPNFKDYETDILDLYILREFEEEFNLLSGLHNIPTNVSVHYLSLSENAVIAAFSMETYQKAMKIFEEISLKGFKNEVNLKLKRSTPSWMQFDKQFFTNGFNVELLMSFNGFPQFFLDDEYELKGPIAAYLENPDGSINLNPIIEYKELFDKLHSMALLSGCKRKVE